MNFELLPNEILLDIFDYFNGIDLRAFYDLNSRFNFLLYKHFRFHCFNFHNLSKRTFDMICQQHLPSITSRVIALSLSDHERTPNQINLFFSYMPSLSQFTSLRSLSLYNLRSNQTIMKIIDELRHLCNLTHLYFHSCSIRNNRGDFQSIVKNVWSLPKLIHCNFSIRMERLPFFCVPTVLNSSLEHLSIYGSQFKWNLINRLFEYTPHLKYLRINIASYDDDYYMPSSLPTLIDLNINIFHMSDTSRMFSFLQNTPNLCRLNFNVWSSLIDGRQWEQIIRNYLPKLKSFGFIMREICPVDQDIEERADSLINSFRSSFWIDEHRWFVRYLIQQGTIHLHTASKTYYHCEAKLPDLFKSTDPHDDQQWVYNHMTSIYNKTFFDQSIPSHIRLSNIEYLRIKLPLNNQFWFVVTNLKQLHSLIVISHADTFQSQLQTLLDQAPRLFYLSIRQDASLPLQMSLFKYTNASIRILDLTDCNHYFNEEECITLTRSPLGIQCQMLSILVKNLESIIILVKNMINLRALDVQCEDEKNSEHLPLTIHDEVIQSLKDRLPSTCSVIRDPDTASRIRIWI